MWDDNKRSNVYVMRAPEAEDESRAEKICKEIVKG